MTHSRPANVPRHRSRREKEEPMDYREKIIAILDMIKDQDKLKYIYQTLKDLYIRLNSVD